MTCVTDAEEREFFIGNLLVRVHCIIVMIRWTGLAPWEFEFPFPCSLTCIFLSDAGHNGGLERPRDQHLRPDALERGHAPEGQQGLSPSTTFKRDFVYHSTLGLRVIKKKKRPRDKNETTAKSGHPGFASSSFAESSTFAIVFLVACPAGVQPALAPESRLHPRLRSVTLKRVSLRFLSLRLNSPCTAYIDITPYNLHTLTLHPAPYNLLPTPYSLISTPLRPHLLSEAWVWWCIRCDLNAKARSLSTSIELGGG